MSLLPKTAYTPEVCVVDMRVHPKEALEHGPHHIHEVWWKRNTILLWKYPRIIHLQLVELFVYLHMG